MGLIQDFAAAGGRVPDKSASAPSRLPWSTGWCSAAKMHTECDVSEQGLMRGPFRVLRGTLVSPEVLLARPCPRRSRPGTSREDTAKSRSLHAAYPAGLQSSWTGRPQMSGKARCSFVTDSAQLTQTHRCSLVTQLKQPFSHRTDQKLWHGINSLSKIFAITTWIFIHLESNANTNFFLLEREFFSPRKL